MNNIAKITSALNTYVFCWSDVLLIEKTETQKLSGRREQGTASDIMIRVHLKSSQSMNVSYPFTYLQREQADAFFESLVAAHKAAIMAATGQQPAITEVKYDA